MVLKNPRYLRQNIHIHRNASLCSYQILRSFSTKNIWILLKAFITYVRPKVEFNACVWSPYLKKDIVLLESVQRNFTRYAFTRCNIPFQSYNDRLCKLGIKSLEYRRLEFDLILMYKICHNLCDLQFSNYFEYRHCKYNLRQHEFTVQTIHNAKQDRFRHFFNRIVSVWNCLSNDLVSASSLSLFKLRLHKFDLHTVASSVF